MLVTPRYVRVETINNRSVRLVSTGVVLYLFYLQLILFFLQGFKELYEKGEVAVDALGLSPGTYFSLIIALVLFVFRKACNDPDFLGARC